MRKLILLLLVLLGGLSYRASGQDNPVVNRLVVVGPPKIYDDVYLRNLLSSLQSQLASIHGVDQATLLSHIGVAQGADLRQSSLALSASAQAPAAAATATAPATTATVSPVTSSAPAPPAAALALPAISSLGQSSLDTYNESLQLSSELTSTTLLLNGALSDLLPKNGGDPKTTVTIGFPITVEPPSRSDRDLENAVAEVRVTVCSSGAGEPPSVVTLLPRERTYNVASLVDKSFLGSISAVLGGFVNVGGSFLWSHKTYYLVQQQETVAFLRAPQNCQFGSKTVTFAWQIHPVLGKKFIRPGNSVNFVQIAIPAEIGGSQTKPIGKACVAVTWRKGDAKGMYLGEDLSRAASGPTQSGEQCYDLVYYNTLKEDTLSVTDSGNGAVTVRVAGIFLPGSTVRLGNVLVIPDTITASHDALTFTVRASAIVAAGQAFIVGRDNRQVPLIRQGDAPATKLAIDRLSVAPYSDRQSLVRIRYVAPGPVLKRPFDPWVVVIGGTVFGLSDAPFFSQDPTKGELALLVPTSLLRSSPTIEMRRLLWPDAGYSDSRPITTDMFAKRSPSVSQVTILSTYKALTLALAGSDLDSLQLVFPSHEDCPDCKVEPMGSMLLKVKIPKPDTPKGTRDAVNGKPDPTEGLRQIVLCQQADSNFKVADGKPPADGCDPNFPRLVVDVPKLDEPKPAPFLKSRKPVPVNTRQVAIEGTLLDRVVSIEHGKLPLPFRLAGGDDSFLIVDLPESIAKVPGGYSFLVTFADKSTTGYLLTIAKSGS